MEINFLKSLSMLSLILYTPQDKNANQSIMYIDTNSNQKYQANISSDLVTRYTVTPTNIAHVFHSSFTIALLALDESGFYSSFVIFKSMIMFFLMLVVEMLWVYIPNYLLLTNSRITKLDDINSWPIPFESNYSEKVKKRREGFFKVSVILFKRKRRLFLIGIFICVADAILTIFNILDTGETVVFALLGTGICVNIAFDRLAFRLRWIKREFPELFANFKKIKAPKGKRRSLSSFYSFHTFDDD